MFPRKIIPDRNKLLVLLREHKKNTNFFFICNDVKNTYEVFKEMCINQGILKRRVRKVKDPKVTFCSNYDYYNEMHVTFLDINVLDHNSIVGVKNGVAVLSKDGKYKFENIFNFYKENSN